MSDLKAETFERQYRQACQDHATAMGEIKRLRAALADIRDIPVSMVNDSESLRHSIRVMQNIARGALPAGTTAKQPMTEDQTGMTADRQVQAMADRINSLVLDHAILRAAIKDLVRICDAVRYTAGLGSAQVERVNQARKLLTAGKR